jgi:hypothetical protein
MTNKHIQVLKEYYTFIAIIYLIIFHKINLETLRHMEGYFANFTFPSATAFDFLV